MPGGVLNKCSYQFYNAVLLLPQRLKEESQLTASSQLVSGWLPIIVTSHAASHKCSLADGFETEEIMLMICS